MLRMTALVLALALTAPLAWAHGNEKHAPAQMTAGRDTAGATLRIAPEAADAVAVLERFSNALGKGELDTVAAELDPAVLILESGGAERSREDYLGGHAKHDAEFLKTAHVALKQRVAQVSGDLAWIGSESEIHASKDGKALAISSSETAVLRKTAQGWKIVHIHWSSRAQR